MAEEFNQLAEEALNTFEIISKKAKDQMDNASNDANESLAVNNTFTSNSGVKLAGIQAANRKKAESLSKEPAIARIEVEDEDKNRRVFYISRHGSVTLSEGLRLASYNSPIGALASLSLGDEKEINLLEGKSTYCIVGKSYFRTKLDKNCWDSINTKVETLDSNITISSLKGLLKSLNLENADELEALLAESDDEPSITEGFKHQVHTAMALRDQPILDEFQDEIFRLPMNSQLMILGPPGTGKTTTLIKRLGQKIDIEFLDENEKAFVDSSETSINHIVNWVMFIPSELLKHYVKEAFNRELISASDETIMTWTSYRGYIARNVLNILKTSTGGRFIYNDKYKCLNDVLLKDSRNWFDGFKKSHKNRVVNQLIQGYESISLLHSKEHSSLINDLKKSLGELEAPNLISIYSKLNSLELNLNSTLQVSKAHSDKLITRERNLLHNKDKTVFDQLGKYVNSLKNESDIEEEEDVFDEDIEQVEVTLKKQTDIQIGVKAYMSTIRSLSRYKFRKISVPKSSKAAKIKSWLQDRLPSDEVLKDIGKETDFQNSLRRFINPTKRYVLDVPSSFREYRKLMLKESTIYDSNPISNIHIEATELDAIIFLILKNARELLSLSFIKRNIQSAGFSYLNKISQLFKTQILVDEATDFSILELACMESLTALNSQSFFACGDFNQRITGNGIRTEEQLGWISAKLSVKKINTVYRQSEKLNSFSKALLKCQKGDLTLLGELHKKTNHPGVSPILQEHLSSVSEITNWLANRIVEIEKKVGLTPTIAVLVNREEEVKPIAESLNKYLEENNLRAVACQDGQTLGQNMDVRVFDIQHIKGLEFEAVFFVDIDKLAEILPDLFDRYLYVGATRAATYLGITCEKSLPTPLNSLRSFFGINWE